MNPSEIIRQVRIDAHELMEKHHISYETGFLSPKDTDQFLPRDHADRERDTYFLSLTQSTRMLPELVAKRGVVRAVEGFEVPKWSFGDLPRENQYVLMLMLSMHAHAAFREQFRYQTVAELYQDREPKYLWPQLAVPLWELHKITGIDPTMAYWLYGLWNKRLKNPDNGHIPDNLEPVFTFTGTKTEKWFLAIHHAIETAVAQAIYARFCAYYTSLYGNDAPLGYLTQCLEEAAKYTMQAVGVLKRMREHLNPRAYFQEVRMFYAWPQLVLYLGVDEVAGVAQHFEGETGGGSAAAHQIGDAVRGTQFRGENKAYVDARRRQMPTGVRELLVTIEQTSKVRDLVLANQRNDRLVRASNLECYAAFDYGLEHDSLAAESIAAFGDTRGTANPVLTFLRNMNEARRACVIYTS